MRSYWPRRSTPYFFSLPCAHVAFWKAMQSRGEISSGVPLCSHAFGFRMRPRQCSPATAWRFSFCFLQYHNLILHKYFLCPAVVLILNSLLLFREDRDIELGTLNGCRKKK